MPIAFSEAEQSQAAAPGARIGEAVLSQALGRIGDLALYDAVHPIHGRVWVHEFWPFPQARRTPAGGLAAALPEWADDYRRDRDAYLDRATAWTGAKASPWRARGLAAFLQDGAAYLIAVPPRGVSLSEALTGPPERLGELAQQLGDALWRLRQGGETHGDISPDSLFVEDEGGPLLQLAGPGAPRAPDAEAAYAPIERFDSPGPESLSPAGDVYSAGAVLFRLAVGRPPASARNRLYRPEFAEVEAPAGAPAGLAAGIDRCMATEPEERPADPRDLFGKPAAAAKPSRRRKAAAPRSKAPAAPAVAAPIAAAPLQAEAAPPPAMPKPAPPKPAPSKPATPRPAASPPPAPPPEPEVEPDMASADPEALRMPLAREPRRPNSILQLGLAVLAGAVIMWLALQWINRGGPGTPPKAAPASTLAEAKPVSVPPAVGQPEGERPAAPAPVRSTPTPPKPRPSRLVCTTENETICGLPTEEEVVVPTSSTRWGSVSYSYGASGRDTVARDSLAAAQKACATSGGGVASVASVVSEGCTLIQCKSRVGYTCTVTAEHRSKRIVPAACRFQPKKTCKMVPAPRPRR